MVGGGGSEAQRMKMWLHFCHLGENQKEVNQKQECLGSKAHRSADALASFLVEAKSK